MHQLQTASQEIKRQQFVEHRLLSKAKVDSSQYMVELVLWPKGKFTFDVNKGFEGEAVKITLKSKGIFAKKENEILSSITSHQMSSNNATLKKENSSIKQEERQTSLLPKFKLFLMLLLVIGAVITFLRCKKYFD